MMDWISIIQMAFGGGVVAGIVEVCAAIYMRMSMEGEYGCAPTPVINLTSREIEER